MTTSPQNNTAVPRRPHRFLAVVWVIAALAAVLPVAAIGMYSLSVTESSLRTLIDRDNQSDAVGAAEFIKSFVGADFGLLRTIATFPTFNNAVRMHDPNRVRERLKRLVACNPTIDRAFVLDADGNMWCDWPEVHGAQGESQASADYFRGAKEIRDVYLSRVYTRTVPPQDLSIAVSMPVFDDQQQIRGVLVLEHRLASFTRWVSHPQGNMTSSVIVLDQDGQLAVHPTSDLWGAKHSEYATLPLLRNVTTTVPFSTEFVDPISQRTVIASVLAIKPTPASRWVVLAEQDKVQAYAPSRRLRTQIALAAAIVAVFGIFAAVSLTRTSQRNRRMAMDLTERNDALQEVMRRREQVQAELDKERYLFHTLMNNLPNRIYFKDAQGRFIMVNQAMLDLFKVKEAKDAIGKSDFDFFSAEEANKSKEDETQIMTTGEAIIDKIKKKATADGRTYWVANTKIPLRDAQGAIIGTFGISHDITRMMTAEEELRKANTAMQQQNEALRAAHEAEVKAMAELKEAQSQLVQSAKLAGLGEMVAGVAHEINNPLAFVSNNVAVLQRDIGGMRRVLECYRKIDSLLAQHQSEVHTEVQSLSEEIDLPYIMEHLDRIFARSTEGLKRIAEIVQGLRTFARTDDGALRLEPRLNEGIESTLTIARGRATKKKVHLEFTPGEIPPIVCNQAKLNQVILNLVANAIDASKEDTVVAVRSFADEKNINIEVSDHGCGMDAATRSHLFEPFYTTKPLGQGVGLGLSISYGIIVKAHHGAIDVTSTPGEGSTFTVRIPRTLSSNNN